MKDNTNFDFLLIQDWIKVLYDLHVSHNTTIVPSQTLWYFTMAIPSFCPKLVSQQFIITRLFHNSKSTVQLEIPSCKWFVYTQKFCLQANFLRIWSRVISHLERLNTFFKQLYWYSLFLTVYFCVSAGVFCAIVSHPADTIVSKLNQAKGSNFMDIAKDLGFMGEINFCDKKAIGIIHISC